MSEIQVKQIPIIVHDLYNVGQSVSMRLDLLNLEGQVVTEETIQAIKTMRADLNKEAKEWELQRKTVKDAVLNPYTEFEEVYKSEVIEKYKYADSLLKDKITVFENKLRDERKEEIKEYFVELLLAEEIDFLDFTQLGIEIKLSDSIKSYKDRIKTFVDKVKDELALIDTQNFKAEILVEYKKTLNAAKAIKEIQDRKEAEKFEADRIKMIETQRRINLLHNLSFVYRDITRTYEHVNHNDIYVLEIFVANAPKNDFELKVAEMTIEINNRKRPTIGSLITKDIPPAYQEPLKAPEVVKPQVTEEIVVASFEVTGTMNQLRGLGEYMKSNGITYKNT